MLINLKVGQYYKVENKMTGLSGNSIYEDRVFEKKDYAFPILSMDDDMVVIDYLGFEYSFPYDAARRNFRPALIGDDIKDFIILKYITGSHAYGTNVETSDTDYKAVFIFPDDWYSRFDFNPDWEEIKEKNHETNEEITYYSLRKFVSLLAVNNPNMLESFDISPDCTVYKHPCIDKLLKSQDIFLSKLCYKAFLGYGVSQIKKADGQDKLTNWDKADMKRKTPLDFCFTFAGQGSTPIEEWLSVRGMDQRFCALNVIDHMHNMYAIYYDYHAHTIVYLKEIIDGVRDPEDISSDPCHKFFLQMRELATDKHNELGWYFNDAQVTLDWIRKHINEDSVFICGTPFYYRKMLGYKGIVLDNSNTIRLSETPKDAIPIGYLSYNKDGYVTHCKQYNRYLTWKRERNDARWTDVEGHDQKIDGKNMLHCMRLINMSEDIVGGRGIIVRRPEAEYLKTIRYGKVDLESLISTATKKLEDLEDLFKNSDLMNEPDVDSITQLYINILFDYKNMIVETTNG